MFLKECIAALSGPIRTHEWRLLLFSIFCSYRNWCSEIGMSWLNFGKMLSEVYSTTAEHNSVLRHAILQSIQWTDTWLQIEMCVWKNIMFIFSPGGEDGFSFFFFHRAQEKLMDVLSGTSWGQRCERAEPITVLYRLAKGSEHVYRYKPIPSVPGMLM